MNMFVYTEKKAMQFQTVFDWLFGELMDKYRHSLRFFEFLEDQNDTKVIESNHHDKTRDFFSLPHIPSLSDFQGRHTMF